MGTLNTLPVRVPIGTVDAGGNVLMTPEFARLLSSFLDRVGGTDGESNTALATKVKSLAAQVVMISTDVSNIQDEIAANEADMLNAAVLQAMDDAPTAAIADLRVRTEQIRTELALQPGIPDYRAQIAEIKIELAMIRNGVEYANQLAEMNVLLNMQRG